MCAAGSVAATAILGVVSILALPASSLRLLIADGAELPACTLAMALRQKGIEALTAPRSSVRAILDLAGRLAPVLVLLDLDLGPPLGDGLPLIPRLVEAGSRVLVVTGVTDRARLGASLDAGAIGLFGKDCGFEELLQTVRRAAEGAPLLSEDERNGLLDALRHRQREDRERLAPFLALSRREQAVLAGLAAGEAASTIADRSCVSLATVRSQIRAVLGKLGVSSQGAAAALAREAGWSPTHT